MKIKTLSISNFKHPKAAYLCLFLVFIFLMDKVVGYWVFTKEATTNVSAMHVITNQYRKNLTFSGIVYGDLDNGSRMTPRRLVCSFDGRGFRNNRVVTDKKVLITGDSFALSAGVSDQDTIQNRLMDILKRPVVYNVAYLQPQDILVLDEFNDFDVLFYIKVERSITPDSLYNSEYRIENQHRQLFNTIMRLSYTYNRLYPPQPPQNSFFEKDGQRFFEGTDEDDSNTLDDSVAMIKAVSDSYRKQGKRFIFVPVPDKYSVYSNVRGQYHGFLNRLYKKLDENGIEYLDLLTPFSVEDGSRLFYWADDTHCSPRGYAEIAAELSDLVTSNLFPTPK